MFFWPNAYKIEIMITFLIEMLELWHITTSAIWFELHDKIVDMDKNYDVLTFSKSSFFKDALNSLFYRNHQIVTD